jgi:Ca-activated chloride channel family protein
MHFAYPYLFWLLPIVPLVWWVMHTHSRADVATMRFSDLRAIAGVKTSWRVRLRPLLLAARAAAIALLIVVLTRPQRVQSSEKVTREGIDIQLALDISLSMKAQDFEPKDRIMVAKEVIAEFIKGRTDDRIGLVVFSGHAFTQVPLTLDYEFMLNLLSQVQTVRRPDGTAIGVALAHSVDGLRNSNTKSKIVILLTDGSNNRGDVDPVQAAEIARALDVRVYTILVGKAGNGEYPVYDPWRDETYLIPAPTAEDEVALREIAERTGGLFFRAGDQEALRAIYEKINQLERSQVASEKLVRYQEAWEPWALGAIVLLALEIFIRTTVLRSIR